MWMNVGTLEMVMRMAPEPSRAMTRVMVKRVQCESRDSEMHVEGRWQPRAERGKKLNSLHPSLWWGRSNRWICA